MNPKQLLTAILAYFQTAKSALNIDLAGVPDEMKALITRLKTDMDAALAALPPIDQVPAALEASQALNWISDTVRRMQEFSASMMEGVTKLRNDLVLKATALNALETRVTNGELVESTEVQRQMAEYRKLSALRRQEMQTCGLPVPVMDDILQGTDDEWKQKITEAKGRREKLATRDHQANDAQMHRLLFGDQTAFEVVIQSLPAKRDPLLGNGGAQAAAEGGAGSASGSSGTPPRIRCL